MCHYDFQGPTATGTGARICTGSGDMPACQLCTRSPNHWRKTAEPLPKNGNPLPYTIDPDAEGWHEDTTPLPGGRDADSVAERLRRAEAMRCVLCGLTTTWISPKGTRCHPSCATMWTRAKRGTQTSPRPSPSPETTASR